MRVLWFEVTEPSSYVSGGELRGGWQDSLERIMKTSSRLELFIVFVSDNYYEVKVIDGVTYIPINLKLSPVDKYLRNYWDVYVKRLLPISENIINKYKPDLIHIFGTEWPFGQIATITKTPVIIHIQGAIIPYKNALYPPGYSIATIIYYYLSNPKKMIGEIIHKREWNNRALWEQRTWRVVNHYMGRTVWDESVSNVMHPGRHYYHVEEALREDFIESNESWRPPSKGIRLVTVGCASLLKGPDLLLKTAKILKSLKIDFEWLVVGNMDKFLQRLIERKEGCRFEEFNVKMMGYKTPRELTKILTSSSIYVHTAYIENSPNSICEAQWMGVPVVSTNVGGISTLVKDRVNGFLVPANDPWQMANAIVNLSNDRTKMNSFSMNGKATAMKRHDDNHIKEQLTDTYRRVLDCTAKLK